MSASCPRSARPGTGGRTGCGDGATIERVYDGDGVIIPERFSEYLDAEGVDIALLFCEYSPKVAGLQPIENMLPLAKHDPRRIRLVANINPHLHYPVADELERQLGLGAVALKLHPVHGGYQANDRALYPAYEVCRSRGIPVIVHCGTSNFPGSMNSCADPVLLDEVLRDFPALDIVLAHGGRGWWYDAAAFLALSYENVWIELSGLPPRGLPEYYSRHNFAPADPAVYLRHRLAGRAGHRAQRPRRRRALPGRGDRRACPGRQRRAGLPAGRDPGLDHRRPAGRPRRRPAGRGNCPRRRSGAPMWARMYGHADGTRSYPNRSMGYLVKANE